MQRILNSCLRIFYSCFYCYYIYDIVRISLCVFIIAKPFNLFSVIVSLEYFNLANVEKNQSLLAVVTGRVVNICESLNADGKMFTLHDSRAFDKF